MRSRTNRSKEIFTPEIREMLAADIAGIVNDYYMEPGNVKAFEEWEAKRKKGTGSAVKDAFRPERILNTKTAPQ